MNVQEAYIVENQPDPEYRAVDAFSQSTAKQGIGVTPLDWHHALDHWSAPTVPMMIGTVCSDYLAFDKCDSIHIRPEGNGNKKEIQDFKVAHGGLVLTIDQYALGVLCARQIQAHPQIQALYELGSMAEGSIYWNDGRRNYPCKGRFDLLTPSVGILNDYKTTSESLSDDSLKYVIDDRKYHWQSAWYRRGLRFAGFTVDHCYITFVCTERPNQVRIIRLEEVDLAYGEEKMLQLLEKYSLCRTENFWPGYGTGVDPLLLHDRARK